MLYGIYFTAITPFCQLLFSTFDKFKRRI
jgi:hypothetical protein